MLALLLWACSGETPAPAPALPVFESPSAALEAWRRGVAEIDRGESGVAAMTQALKAQPQSLLLRHWLALALARSGALEEALEEIEAVLAVEPSWGLAHFNRACWLSRLGRVEEAGAALELALRTGADPSLVRGEEDLDPLRDQPRFSAMFAVEMLQAEVAADPEALLVDSVWEVSFQSVLRGEEDFSISLPGPSDLPAHLQSIVEDRRGGDDATLLSLDFVYRISGPGEGSLGPFEATAGGREAVLPAVSWRFLDPAGRGVPLEAVRLLDFRSVSERLAGLAGATARRMGSVVTVRAEPGDRVQFGPDPVESVALEIREEGQVRVRGWQVVLPLQSPVVITRRGAVVYEGTP